MRFAVHKIGAANFYLPPYRDEWWATLLCRLPYTNLGEAIREKGAQGLCWDDWNIVVDIYATNPFQASKTLYVEVIPLRYLIRWSPAAQVFPLCHVQVDS